MHLNGSVGGLGAAALQTSGRNGGDSKGRAPCGRAQLLTFVFHLVGLGVWGGYGAEEGGWVAWQRPWGPAAKLAAPNTQYAAKVLE